MAKIDVIVFEPGKDGVEKQIDDSLEAMQEIVGGYIEHVPLGQGLIAVCNEDGGLTKLPPNRFGLVGTVFVARVKGNGYASLTVEDRESVGRLDTR